ncbi:hypothetical protein [Nocardia sp. AG03]|uniref:hypothetical protein n=1 Tax=Nocardia sp. AG03 TaxID=3025312 RepID=UPI0024181CF8|nr:hypothetical protein [Nocardia sp. AG03]
MQTHRHAALPAAPLIDPVAPDGARCRRLRIVARIDDTPRWETTAARLLGSGLRRWRDRPDIADHPALCRWSRIQDTQQMLEPPCLRTVFTALAIGEELASGDACADFATAIMLLSSCPAEAIVQADPLGAARTLRFSVYAFREDDLPLAEDLITTTVAACGTVLARRCAVLAPAATPRPAPVSAPAVPEPLVIGTGTAAR